MPIAGEPQEPTQIWIPQNKPLKDIHYFGTQRQYEKAPMVNFTCNGITYKDSVSIFHAAKRSAQEPVLEIELEDESKTTMTNEPTEESDATVPTAQFIE